MHEMALAEAILRVVLNASEGEKVRKVRLEVGKLQMVAPDSLEFSFQLLAAGTPAAEAVLEIDEKPARLRCRLCSAESELDLPPLSCRVCGALDIEVIAGDAVLVDEVELESGQTITRQPVPADEILKEHVKEHGVNGGGADHKH